MTSIMVRNENIDSEVQALQIVAKNAVESGLYTGIGGQAKIFMILMSAKELGIPPMQALNGGIWNIQGKIEISARMVNAMLRRAGISITIKKLDSEGCILYGKRKDTGDECTVQFLKEDAILAGVMNRDPWKKHYKDMCFARAISILGRRLAPDIMGTSYVEGEISAENEERSQRVENLPIADSEEILEFRASEATEINAFLDSWQGDRDEHEDYLNAVYKAYPSKTMCEVVRMLTSDLLVTNEKFDSWKMRQQAKKIA